MARLVKSVYNDQDELLAAMVGLHSGGTVECDPTFGRGLFYRYALEPPRFRSDLEPRMRGIVRADVCRLPLKDNSVGSVMFDPPFLDGASKKTPCGKMPTQYSYWRGWMPGLRMFYADALAEIRRVLKPKGILYFKCQDCVSGRSNFFNHVHIHNEATRLGFRPRDLFILLAKNRPLQWNLFKQIHARKYHCYFWVFEKRKQRGVR